MRRYAIINLLRQSYTSLVFPDELKAVCQNPQDWSRWLDTHYRKTWIVHSAPPSSNPTRNVNYLGRYIRRLMYRQRS